MYNIVDLNRKYFFTKKLRKNASQCKFIRYETTKVQKKLGTSPEHEEHSLLEDFEGALPQEWTRRFLVQGPGLKALH